MASVSPRASEQTVVAFPCEETVGDMEALVEKASKLDASNQTVDA